jgi:hypothetical protein
MKQSHFSAIWRAFSALLLLFLDAKGTGGGGGGAVGAGF